jgi:RNA polymerase sigma-70 factor (ECF subfamily)
LTQSPQKRNFAAAWVEVQQAVATFIAACGPKFHDGEDILQKVAVIAFERYDVFDPQRAAFLSWTLGIARHEVMHWQRSISRDRHLFSPEIVDMLAEVQSSFGEESSYLAQALEWCIKLVRGRPREVLELRYMEDLSPTEIAERLRTSSSSIRVTLSRTRKSLRDCVDRRLESDEVRT